MVDFKASSMVENLDMEYMLDKVRCYILNSMDTRDHTLREMALYFSDNQGKMLRPILTLCSGLIGGSGEFHNEELYVAAAGVETLHMSALVHDDILDRAEIRRGQASVNTIYGKDKALLLGDYFYSRALHLLSSLSHNCILKQALQVIARMVEGEIKQQRQAFDFGIGIKDYITRISYKTASLTSLSCYAGARTANLPDDQIRLLVKMGHDFGKAYQIRDDILDFLGDEDLLKKPPSDLAQGTVTLPMIFLLNKIGKEDGEKVTREPYLCHPLKIDAVKEAADYCNRLLVRSLKHLRFFPPCPIKQKMVKTLEKVHINT